MHRVRMCVCVFFFHPIDSVVCVHLFVALHISVALHLSVIMVLSAGITQEG